MNNGRKAPSKEEILAYNGGLFKTDELLDGLTIDDELLRKHCLKHSEYDFDSEANVLQAEISRTDKQIDQLVYQLYGLSEEEIRIVEQAS